MCRQYEVNELYNFETWGRQLSAFIEEIVKEPAFLICNSVGGNMRFFVLPQHCLHMTVVVSGLLSTQWTPFLSGMYIF